MTTNDRVVSGSYITTLLYLYILLFYLCLHLTVNMNALCDQLKYASMSTFM